MFRLDLITRNGRKTDVLALKKWFNARTIANQKEQIVKLNSAPPLCLEHIFLCCTWTAIRRKSIFWKDVHADTQSNIKLRTNFRPHGGGVRHRYLWSWMSIMHGLTWSELNYCSYRVICTHVCEQPALVFHGQQLPCVRRLRSLGFTPTLHSAVGIH